MPRFGRILTCALALFAGFSSAADADVVRLSNGGELRGELEAAQHDSNSLIEFRSITGARVILDRQHVATFIERRPVFEHYETRVKNAAETVEAQWELAEWCREHRLVAQRRVHLQNVVDLDPNHEKAHRLLGHVQRNGEWVDRDDEMLKRGYVKFKGEYVTLQERERLQELDAQREVEKDWHKKVRLWYLWANGRNPARRDEGLDQLQRIETPDALPALAYFLENNRDVQWRGLFVGLLGRIPGERPVGTLTEMSLRDADAQIRSAAFDAIGPERVALAVPRFVAALQSGENIIVRRAGASLGKIGDVHVVPQLIEALVTTHTYRVRVPTNEGTYSFNKNGSMATGDMLLPPGVEAALRTGMLPNGVIVVDQSPNYVRTKVVSIRRDHKNAEVLAALNELTGESYGYDENAWRIWWAAQINQPNG